jgi:hypothetical protein
MRRAFALLLANYIAFALFVAVRPPRIEHLRELDRASASGMFMMSSAEPITHLAARPLYSWSRWHGGERWWVKIVEVANLPALIAAGALTLMVQPIVGASAYYGASYIRAVLFLLFATIQWLLIGRCWR